MFLEVVSKLISESLLSLYPIFVKKIGISSSLQLWTRLTTYVLIAIFFVNWSFIKSSLLTYYESTEEFEKCKFISDFFDRLEKEVKISQVLGSIKKS